MNQEEILKQLQLDPVFPTNPQTLNNEEDDEEEVEIPMVTPMLQTPANLGGILALEELNQTTEGAADNDNTSEYDHRIETAFQNAYDRKYEKLKQLDEENYQQQLKSIEIQRTGENAEVIRLKKLLEEIDPDDPYRLEVETDIKNLTALNAGYAIPAFEEALINYSKPDGANTFVEKLTAYKDELQYIITEDGNPLRRAIGQKMLNDGYDLDVIAYTLTGAEFSPFLGTAIAFADLPDIVKDTRKSISEGDMYGAALNIGLGALTIGEGILLTKAATKPLKRSMLSNGKKLSATTLMEAETEVATLAKEQARNEALKNKDIYEGFIDEFESNTGYTVSDVAEDGTKTLNLTKAQNAGRQVAEELYDEQQNQLSEVARGTLSERGKRIDGLEEADINAEIAVTEADKFVSPIVVPEKLDSLVAIASDLRKAAPDKWDNDLTVSENLFKLTVEKDILENDTLINSLVKYNLSFDDYVLAVLGSGSDAGRVLNRFSQIAKAKPISRARERATKATLEAQKNIHKIALRVENMRRGGLVSQVATAARNLSSAGMRAPAEALGNIMDTALYNMSKQYEKKGAVSGATAFTKTFVTGAHWQDSFRHLKYMFAEPVRTKQFTDYILKRPELSEEFSRMFDNINEIQRSMGKGSGGAVDTVLSAGETFVDVLNTPNRLQEFMVRRGAFLGELERLVKREYDIDLFDTLGEGKIRSLLNNDPSIIKKGSPSFDELITRSVDRALDMTYAKQPDVKVFREMTSFITRNGLTTVIPFPRFMFNSLELMGQLSLGASIPAGKKIYSLMNKNLPKDFAKITDKDRQRITRNMMGVAGAIAAYQYRTEPTSPENYKDIGADDVTNIDVTPQYPLRQFLWVGEFVKRSINGTMTDWLDMKEARDTFLGINFRSGVGNSLFEEVAGIIEVNDLRGREDAAKLLGDALGNYFSTWLVPAAQIIDAQRAMGYRGLDRRETKADPNLTFWDTFVNSVQHPIKARGFDTIFAPSTESEKYKIKEDIFKNKKRTAPVGKLLFGLNFKGKPNMYENYIISKGFQPWELGSNSRVPSVKNMENAFIRERLPEYLDVIMIQEEMLRKEYNKNPEKFAEKEDTYVNRTVNRLIRSASNSLKSNIKDLVEGQTSEYNRNQIKFRKLSRNDQEEAISRFYREEGYHANPAEPSDLEALLLYGTAGAQIMREKEKIFK
jgi:hypothetical protein